MAVPSLALLMLPYAALPTDNPIVELLLRFPLPLIAAAYVVVVPALFWRTLRSSFAQQITGTKFTLSYTRTLFVFVAVIGTWGLFGLAFCFLVASLFPVPNSQIPSLVFSSTVSIIVSIVAFFAPVGIGVREGVMTFLLGFWLPGPYPALVAVLSRIVLIAAELLSFAVATRL